MSIKSWSSDGCSADDWGRGPYSFTRDGDATRKPGQLVGDLDPEVADVLAACVRVRDLVNTPTQDMGPQELEDVAREMANRHGAKFESIVGDELLEQNFPSIHAVGRASPRAPRLIRLDWGDDAHEPVVLVGKDRSEEHTSELQSLMRN